MVLDNVRQVLGQLKGKTFRRLFLVACGGSQALMMPSKIFADKVSKTLMPQHYNSNEFIALDPVTLNEDSVVILCSQEGKTPETVKAAAFAREKGASVITIAMVDDSLLEKAGGSLFVKYGYYETCDAIDTSYGVMYLLVAGLIDNQEGTNHFGMMSESLIKVNPVIQKAKKDWEETLTAYGEKNKDAKVIYSLAAGTNYSQSYVLCNCYLMEMQWINAIPIHAGEFFHGPFEIIEKGSPVILLMGCDSCRFLEERALEFCRKYTDNLLVIDASKCDLSGIDENYTGYMTTLILNNLCRLFCKKIAITRNHSLDIRRYMHIVEY